jgi:hypothetical protein
LVLFGLAAPLKAQMTVGFEFLAQTDTIYQFSLLSSARWIDGEPRALFRSAAYPDAKVLEYTIGYHYLYSLSFSPPKLGIEFVLEDSLNSGPMITADFDGDGNIEIMGKSFMYHGEGTELSLLKYTDGTWKEFKQVVPYYIDALFAAHLYDTQGDGFILVFRNDTTTVCDTCYYDNEYPNTGLIFGNWDGERLNLHVDSTFHYTLQSLGAAYGDQDYVYIYETLFDSTTWTADGPLEIGCLVKYRFDKESAKLERLYYAGCLNFGWGLTSDNSSGVYVRDSLIIILDNKAMQWFLDDGESLTQTLMQFTSFDCYESLLFDIDGDGQNDLICAEPIVKDSFTEDPNWVIKAYKLLK